MSKLSQRLVMGAVVVAALAAGLVVGGMVRDDSPGNDRSGAVTELERYEIGGEFELVDQTGDRRRPERPRRQRGDDVLRLHLLPRRLSGHPRPDARGQGGPARGGCRQVQRAC